MQLWYELLSDSLPLQLKQDDNPNGLATHLQTTASAPSHTNNNPPLDIISFWKDNVLTLHNFVSLARKIFCLNPSSATAERISLLNSVSMRTCVFL